MNPISRGIIFAIEVAGIFVCGGLLTAVLRMLGYQVELTSVAIVLALLAIAAAIEKSAGFDD